MKGSIRRILAIAITVVGLLTATVIVGEAIYGFLRPDDYCFGNEAMVGHGGWAYKTQNHYLVSGVLTGIVILSGTLGLSALISRWPTSERMRSRVPD